MKISVIIVNWNTRGLLAHCLESLRRDEEAGRVEVIVVDNGSVDGSTDYVAAHFPAVRLIRNDGNLGFTKAVNQGYRVSRAKYVLLLNSDAVVSDDALKSCAAFLDDHPEVAVVGCKIVYPDGRFQSSCFRFKNLTGIVLRSLFFSQLFPRSYFLNRDRYGEREWERPTQVDCVMGSFMMIRKSAIRQEDLLDEGYFMYGEEEDLCRRLQDAGQKTYFIPTATIAHHHAGSSKAADTSAWKYGVNRRAMLRFLWKWRGVSVAWLANLILLLDLIPRMFGWLFLDLVDSARSGNLEFRRSMRGKIIAFHLEAVVRPSRFAEPWGPPDAPSPSKNER